MWPARGKHTPMPPKPWPTSYLLEIRHDLAHSGRSSTCKQHNPQTVIHHTINIYNQLHFYIYNIKCIQCYHLSIKLLLDIDTTTLHKIKETTQDTLNDSTRILHQATTSCQSSSCSPLDNVSYLRGVVEGLGQSISVKKQLNSELNTQWVNITIEKYKPQTWVHDLLYLIQMSPISYKILTINR